MILERLRLCNFRCYDEAEIHPDERFNVVRGLNGAGKTSLLEAIGLVAFLRSFRSARNGEMLKKGCEEGRVSATIRNGELKAQLDVRLWPKRKHATFNDKSCRYISEYIGRISAVSFSPADLEIVRGGPEHRRVWVDRLCQVIDPGHADIVSRYQKVIDQRNRLLKSLAESPDTTPPSDLSAWSEEAVLWGSQVVQNRLRGIEKTRGLISRYYDEIAGQKAAISIRYSSSIFGEITHGQGSLHSLELIPQLLEKCLREALARERVVGSTLVGPHRDDLELFLDGNPVKSFGSQGEARSLVLAMRLAEADMHKTYQHTDPIVLIDDFSSELDARRRAYLLEYLAVSGSQVFLSTTEDLRIGKTFEVNEGLIAQAGSARNSENDGHAANRNQ